MSILLLHFRDLSDAADRPACRQTGMSVRLIIQYIVVPVGVKTSDRKGTVTIYGVHPGPGGVDS